MLSEEKLSQYYQRYNILWYCPMMWSSEIRIRFQRVYSNTYIKILILFCPFYNYSNLDPSLQNKRNSSQQSKSSQELSSFRLQTLIKLSFSIMYRVVLIYVYFWSNLFFSILTSLLLISIYLRKYKLSVVKYPWQFKWMQLEIKRQFF